MSIIDWSWVIAELERRGFRTIDIAAQVDKSESWVCRVRRGGKAAVRYEHGMALLELLEMSKNRAKVQN